MRIAILLSLILLGSQAAKGQSPDCRTIAENAERLACYDKAAQPAATTAQPAQRAKKDFTDPTLVDESTMKIRIKSICRGC